MKRKNVACPPYYFRSRKSIREIKPEIFENAEFS